MAIAGTTNINDTAAMKLETIQKIMDMVKLAQTVYKEIPGFDPTHYGFEGIKAITFDGLGKNGQKTKVFAYYGLPELASLTDKVPAVVLLHGGGGHPYLEWIKMWNDRGYAAIAFDNTGFFPTNVNAGYGEGYNDWVYGLEGSFNEQGYINAPNNDGVFTTNDAVEDMWLYHAVGQTLLVNNILRSDNRVDLNKIGAVGISWGGVILSIALGYDNRFAFAIPIYGSGYLDESLAWIKNHFSMSNTQAIWSAANNFGSVNMPVLWLCWNDDYCFSINSNSKSYLDTVKNNSNTLLSIKHAMYHSHAMGWTQMESMQFADSVVKNGVKLTSFVNQPVGVEISTHINIDAEAELVSAALYYITQSMTYSEHAKYHNAVSTYMDQIWQTTPLKISGDTVFGEVPSETVGYYIELKTNINGDVYTTTSVYTTI